MLVFFSEYDKNSSLDVETIINNTDCQQKKKEEKAIFKRQEWVTIYVTDNCYLMRILL